MPMRRRPNHHVIVGRDRPTIVFVTICTAERRPLLANDRVHVALREVWSNANAWRVGRYVVMPDHVHCFVAPGEPQLPLSNWVSYCKRMCTRRLGDAVWQEEYWDTTLRDPAHAIEKWAYVEQNPVRAGLVANAADWPWQGELNELAWR